jgi:hypothetical protein
MAPTCPGGAKEGSRRGRAFSLSDYACQLRPTLQARRQRVGLRGARKASGQTNPALGAPLKDRRDGPHQLKGAGAVHLGYLPTR